MSKSKKKKKQKSSADKPKPTFSEKGQPDSEPLDFGGLPDRDLKNNLGCG